LRAGRLCSFSQFVQFGKQSSNALTPLFVFRKFSWRVLRQSALSKKLRLLVEKSPQFVADLGDSVALARNIPFIRHDEYLRGAPKRPQLFVFQSAIWRRGAPKPPPPFSERQARPIRRLNRTSHLAYPIRPSVPQVWLNSPSSIPLQCLKTYAIFVQTARPDSVGVSGGARMW